MAQHHPFVDGNKRTAFAVTWTFLAINDVRIIANPDDAHTFIIGLHDDGRFAFRQLEACLRHNTLPASGK